MKCVDCDEDVTPRNAWAEVVGWEKTRNQGGTNHVALRKRTGRLMHESCMALRKSKIAAGQGTLV